MAVAASSAGLMRWLSGGSGGDASTRRLVTLLVAFVLIVVRYAISLGSYSGAGTPPMFGDYEAQRHWMEITSNLPIGDWYRNTTSNDLQYWGLDYPPMSAYLARVLGALARHPIVSLAPMVELYASRGYESVGSKLFMRLSVLALDVVLFFPAVWQFVRLSRAHGVARGGTTRPNRGVEWARRIEACMLVLLQPCFLLIDHGHFQYNCVALALALWATVALVAVRRREVAASVLFTLALCFKHMALYMAPAFFFYLLACCAYRTAHSSKALHLAKIGVAVLATAGLCVAPLCLFHAKETTCGGGVLQLVARLFPFQRGLFEDKVANVWCTLDIVLKLRRRLDHATLALCALSATLVGIAPMGAELLRRAPTPRRFVYALFNSSLAFFLLSYQVHEKSILLPMLPAALLFATEEAPFLALSCGVVAAFSTFPLLRRDGQALAYVATQALFLLVALTSDALRGAWVRASASARRWRVRLLMLSFVGMLALHTCEAALAPPWRYPDLYPVLFAAFSCAHFCVFFVVGNYIQWTLVERTSKQKAT